MQNSTIKKEYKTKEDVILLIEKGLVSSSKVKLFMSERENLIDDYVNIYDEGKYCDLIKKINIDKYKNPEFKFVFQNGTDEEDILGYFSEENNLLNGNTYIRIDIKTGEIRFLDNNFLKVTIEKNNRSFIFKLLNRVK